MKKLALRKINFSVQEMKPTKIPTACSQWNVVAGWCLLVVASLCWAILVCWRGWDFNLGEEGTEFHTVSGKMLLGFQRCGYKNFVLFALNQTHQEFMMKLQLWEWNTVMTPLQRVQQYLKKSNYLGFSGSEWHICAEISFYPFSSVCLNSSNTYEVLHLPCATAPWSLELQPWDRKRSGVDLSAGYPEEYRTTGIR